jgi:hypothetical protein
VAELADARDSKTRHTPAQVPETASTYDTPPKALGALLGAFAAEIGPQAPHLAAVISAWPGLPQALKAGILAMVKAAAGETPAK